jgi:hypothetical protein
MDSSWNSATYRATPLQCLPHQAYVQDMTKLGIVDIAPELLQEMSYQSKHKQQFNMEAMQKVAGHMNLKPCEGAQFSQVNSMALALMVNPHTTDGPLRHFNAGRAGFGQGMGRISHAVCASLGA